VKSPGEFFSTVFFLQILPRANRPDGSKTLLQAAFKKIPLIFSAAMFAQILSSGVPRISPPWY
jgi:hypothetical protein